jgi:hypothetical protein
MVAPVTSLSPLGPVFGVEVSVSVDPAAPLVVYVASFVALNGISPVLLQFPESVVEPLSVCDATFDLYPLTEKPEP